MAKIKAFPIPDYNKYLKIKSVIPDTVKDFLDIVINSLKSMDKTEIVRMIKNNVNIINELNKSNFGKTILKTSKDIIKKYRKEAELFFNPNIFLIILFYEDKPTYNIINKIGFEWLNENIKRLREILLL